MFCPLFSSNGEKTTERCSCSAEPRSHKAVIVDEVIRCVKAGLEGAVAGAATGFFAHLVGTRDFSSNGWCAHLKVVPSWSSFGKIVSISLPVTKLVAQLSLTPRLLLLTV